MRNYIFYDMTAGGAEEVLTPETYEAAQIAYALARGNFTARATNFTESLLSLATGSAANLHFEDIGNAGKHDEQERYSC